MDMETSYELDVSYGLEEVHSLLITALEKFDQVCRENGIYYSLHGGALLGAERNHKLIPWDDDIDVSMMRLEYKKLKEVTKKLYGVYYLDEETMWFPRFVMKKGDSIVYIDILIWDYISEKRWQQQIKIGILRAFQGMMKPHIDYKRFGLLNRFLLLSTHIVGKLIPKRIQLKWFHVIEERWLVGGKECIHRSNDAFKGVSYIFDKNYMDDYSELELEGKRYLVNQRYHEFLERNYGKNYLMAPPMVERRPEHEIMRANLSKSRPIR